MRKGVLLTYFFTFSSAFLFAQKTDTLSLAKELNKQYQFKKAEKLLATFSKSQPNNLNVQWLYAQTSYWAHHFKKSKQLYEGAISIYPKNYFLQLDYAKKLVELGEFEKALPIINTYLAYDSTAADAHNALAKIAYYQLDYKTSKSEISKTLAVQPQNQDALETQQQVVKAKAPWIKLSTSYRKDDQPLQNITPMLEGGVSLNSLANLHSKLQAPLFIKDGKVISSTLLVLGNKFIFPKIGFSIDAEAGFIQQPDGTLSGVANLELKKSFVKHLELSALIGHQSYLYTRAILANSLMYLNYEGALAWNDENRWMARVSFVANHFYTDKNLVYTASAWFLSPPLKLSVLEFRLGYSFNFSSSLHNRFEATKSVNELITNWDPTAKIAGVYNPYFTPYKQSMHQALVSILIHPIKRIDIGLKGSIGLYGSTQTPYFYLNKDVSGSTIMSRSFSKQTFFPMEATAFVAIQANKKISLRADYTYLRTFFYTSHYVGLSLKISFWNEHKAR